jgi:dehydrogenase/reductase SDR family member 7B
MYVLTNKVMIVTGASSGIGKAIAEEGLSKGIRVVMAARNVDAMKAVAEASGCSEENFLIVKTDVGSREDCRNLVERTIEKFGSIDILINNAGISMRALFEQTDLSVLERLMKINFWGAVYCTHFALPWLLKSKGSVVGVSSIAGYKGLPARTGYSASKFALQGFLESLRIENRKNGLHVLIACPGFTASNIRSTALYGDGSEQGESPRDESAMMPAEKVAILIFKAIEKKKHRLILTRQGKLTVLLNKFFPMLVDGLVYRHMATEPDSPFK